MQNTIPKKGKVAELGYMLQILKKVKLYTKLVSETGR